MSDIEPGVDRERTRRGPWDSALSTAPAIVGTDAKTAGSREPMFRAPAPVMVLVAALLAAYALQRWLGSDAVIERFAFSPASLTAGRWSGVLTALFVHGGWAHVLMNTVGALAFGAPVARLFGPRIAGVVGFFAFYLACGALSCLGYALVHPGSPNLLVGASGAVSGLMGAASRLIERRPENENGDLAPFSSRTVIGMAAGWAVVNGLVALVGFGPGTGGAPVAWEAHLFGYAAGLLLLRPTARLLGRITAP